jgi:hypothetical protein
VVGWLGFEPRTNGLKLRIAEPALSITREADSRLDLAWPASPSGFTLVSTVVLPASNWVAVPGVRSNRISIAPAGEKQFYRLIKP